MQPACHIVAAVIAVCLYDEHHRHSALSLPSCVVLLLHTPISVRAPRRAAAAATAMPRTGSLRTATASVPVVSVVSITTAAPSATALLTYTAPGRCGVAAACVRIREPHATRTSTATDDCATAASCTPSRRPAAPRAFRLAVSDLTTPETLHTPLVCAATSCVLLHLHVPGQPVLSAVHVAVVRGGAVAAVERSGRERGRRAVDVTQLTAHVAVDAGQVPEGR